MELMTGFELAAAAVLTAYILLLATVAVPPAVSIVADKVPAWIPSPRSCGRSLARWLANPVAPLHVTVMFPIGDLLVPELTRRHIAAVILRNSIGHTTNKILTEAPK